MSKRPQPECPESERLAFFSHESNKIGDFIAWLRENGMQICQVDEDDEGRDAYYPAYRGDAGINALLAEYYGIDLEKVEQEREALLDWIREQHEETDEA